MILKPNLFIGSSVEGLDVAYALQENLERSVEVTVWSQGVFKPSGGTLENLTESLNLFDFAAFVFSPDDTANIRNQSVTTVRDNVIFEFGLFVGRLGKERCFFVLPRGEESLHLPTDLLGITPLTFDSNRSDKNLTAATGAASNQIRKVIAEKGKSRQTSNEVPESMAPVDTTQVIARARKKQLLRNVAQLYETVQMTAEAQPWELVDSEIVKLYNDLLEATQSLYPYALLIVRKAGAVYSINLLTYIGILKSTLESEESDPTGP